MAPLCEGAAASAASPNLVVSFGEMLIDFVPDVAGISLAESGGFVKAPGGAPANVACAISKLGGSSAFVGKVLCYPRRCCRTVDCVRNESLGDYRSL